MKKLILLAIVVFGFAATSFAQVSAGASANGQIQLPSAPAAFSVNWFQDMDFGTLLNNATAGNDATLTIFATGLNSKSSNLTVTGVTPRPAKFLCKNAFSSPVTLDQISLSPLTFADAGGTWSFTTGVPIASQTTADIRWTDVSEFGTHGSGQYMIAVGGLLTLHPGAVGNINITGLTVTVNHP